ncbi:hypothetical protein [Dyella humicola]|uniref:hypothetical protein n=1 Tax=Dyella humicola TaxID=2992126 RepID=UPI00225A0F1F|nr:hypothetical protein [Dyella humicola]
MFELERESDFFRCMSCERALLVQNVEILFDNKLLLDASYHHPKDFILNLNNCLRSMLFFVESSTKNAPDWLKTCVSVYREKNLDKYEMLKNLRDVSMHQALIFPKESLVMGLYRIKSQANYVLKIGIGDHGGPGEYAWDIAMMNSEDIFHQMLVFHSMTFMDLEHSALAECLGMTRKWFFKMHFKNKRRTFDETIDVYNLFCDFANGLLDEVCEAFAERKGIRNSIRFTASQSEHNHVNTILEIDLYPSLFKDWWEDEGMEPLNAGIRLWRWRGRRLEAVDAAHKRHFGALSTSADDYVQALKRYAAMSDDEVSAESTFDGFFSFVNLNDWHAKRAFGHYMENSSVDPSEVMTVHRLGRVYTDDLMSGRKEVAVSGERFRTYIQDLALKLEKRLKRPKERRSRKSK